MNIVEVVTIVGGFGTDKYVVMFQDFVERKESIMIVIGRGEEMCDFFVSNFSVVNKFIDDHRNIYEYIRYRKAETEIQLSNESYSVLGKTHFSISLEFSSPSDCVSNSWSNLSFSAISQALSFESPS